MKFPLSFSATALLLSDAALAFHLPAFIVEPRQQPPKCSLYSGFKDSPSFTSLCKQLPRATKDAASSAQGFVPGSTKKVPSISTQLFTFDGSATSTVSPVHPEISLAAGGSTFEMQNYTVTTSGAKVTTSSKPVPSDVEVNCYLIGSKVPMSQCTRTQGLTHHHGYTYTKKTTTSSKPVPSTKAASSSMPASTKAAASSTKPTSSSKASTSSKAMSSSGKAAPSPSASRAANTTASAPASRASVAFTGMLPSINCTRTMDLTHKHGYTYPDTFSYGTAVKTSTAKLSSSLVVSNLTNPASSTATTSSSKSQSSAAKSSSAKITSLSRSTLSTVYTNSYDCNNITNAEPYRVPSSGAAQPYLSTVGVSSKSAPVPSSTSSSKSQVSSSPKPIVLVNKMEWTSTTTVVDATVTTLVPCATDVGKPPAALAKRADFFMASAAGGICDAGVYCVNSTSVSDASPAWHWDAVALKQGQTCLEDNVFNTDWVAQQCACAGL